MVYGGHDMRRILGAGFAVLVNAVLIGALAWSSLPPPPNGEVSIADMTNGNPIVVASREH